MLFIFDDVVGQIKKLETSPQLAQLYLNRRHLLTNGTISLITVSQKYTMVPSRLRSNMSWLIFFKLNPNDIEAIYRDVVTLRKT